MAYPAVTPDSILLKYIQLRVQSLGQERLAIATLAEEITAVQDRHPDVRLYDADGDMASLVELISQDLRFLEGMGFVRCDFSNPHVRITEWGRFFASVLDLPSNLRQALPQLAPHQQALGGAP